MPLAVEDPHECAVCWIQRDHRLKDSMVVFHGDDFMAEGHDSHDSSLDKLDAVLDSFEIKRSPRIGPTASHEGVFLHRTRRLNESGFSYRPDPKHVDALIATLYAIQERIKQTRCVS